MNAKVTTSKLLAKKSAKQPISMLTAYDHLFARILDETGLDIILVGDSLGNVALGYRNTVPVTMLEMMVHTQAVSRGVQNAMVVADLPFGSYQKDSQEAVSNAIELVKAGAEAVKLEGAEYLDTIKAIIKAGIPVMGHLGFTPQAVYQIGGYNYKAKFARNAPAGRLYGKILLEAKLLEKVGCFAIVLEMIPEDLAKKIAKALKIPVIGIGAGRDCDGQVLVTADMLGLFPNPPSFVKKQADLRSLIKKAVKKYLSEI